MERASDDQIKEVLTSDNWDLVALGGITTAYASIKKIVKLTRAILPRVTISLGGGVLAST